MIEPDDATPEGHEFGLKAGVVGYEYGRSIEDVRRAFRELYIDAVKEFLDSQRPWMSMAQNKVVIFHEPFDGLLYHRVVDFERRPQFGYIGPNGSRWFPMERDGNRTWFVLIPQTGVPRVQLWTADDEGRPVITPGPASRYFIVGAYEGDDISVLFRNGEGTVVRSDFSWET